MPDNKGGAVQIVIMEEPVVPTGPDSRVGIDAEADQS